jgi:hypothetical protein
MLCQERIDGATATHRFRPRQTRTPGHGDFERAVGPAQRQVGGYQRFGVARARPRRLTPCATGTAAPASLANNASSDLPMPPRPFAFIAPRNAMLKGSNS